MPAQISIYGSFKDIYPITWLSIPNAVATSNDTNYLPINVVKSTRPTASALNDAWLTSTITIRRITVGLSSFQYFNKIRLVNYYDAGTNMNYGVKHIKINVISTLSASFLGDLRVFPQIHDGIIPMNTTLNDGSNYFDIQLNKLIYGRYIAIDIYSNHGGAKLGIRRIEVGRSAEKYPMNVCIWDASDFNNNTLGNNELYTGLNTRVYSLKSINKEGSVQLGQCENIYGLFNGKPGFKAIASPSTCFSSLNNIFSIDNMWHISIIALNTNNVSGTGLGDNFGVSMDSYSETGSDRFFIRLVYNKINMKVGISCFASSLNQTVYSPFDVYLLPIDTIALFAYKLYNRTYGVGTAIQYYLPNTDNPVTLNYSPNIIRNVPYRPLSGGWWSSGYNSNFTIYYHSINECNDSTILSRIQELRSKWAAI